MFKQTTKKKKRIVGEKFCLEMGHAFSFTGGELGISVTLGAWNWYWTELKLLVLVSWVEGICVCGRHSLQRSRAYGGGCFSLNSYVEAITSNVSAFGDSFRVVVKVKSLLKKKEEKIPDIFSPLFLFLSSPHFSFPGLFLSASLLFYLSYKRGHTEKVTV